MFFSYHLVPLCPPLPSSHHTVIHVHESFFFFVQSLHPLTSLPLAVICSHLDVCYIHKTPEYYPQIYTEQYRCDQISSLG